MTSGQCDANASHGFLLIVCMGVNVLPLLECPKLAFFFFFSLLCVANYHLRHFVTSLSPSVRYYNLIFLGLYTYDSSGSQSMLLASQQLQVAADSVESIAHDATCRYLNSNLYFKEDFYMVTLSRSIGRNNWSMSITKLLINRESNFPFGQKIQKHPSRYIIESVV
jgi:hypothetical protein